MNQASDQQDTQIFMWIAILVIALFIIPATYAANAGSVNGTLLGLAKLQLKPFVPFFEEAHIAFAKINQADPASLSWEQTKKILGYSGAWLRWLCFPLLILLGTLSLFMGRINKLTRNLDMQKLLMHNAETFACLCPIVGKGKYLLSPNSYDSGLWRIALSPVQFAVENGLLLKDNGKPFASKDILQNGLASTDLKAYGQCYFDEEKAAKVLEKQLGKAFKSYASLSPHRKALATAFLAYGAGDKTTCMDILDALSTSYTEIETIPKCPISENENFQKNITNIWKKHEHFLNDKLMKRHTSFELTWFMALLVFARKKGVLASSQFIWLRPFDRSLWYALNQSGGRVAWAESFAAWTHYTAEEKAEKTVRKANMKQAIERFKETLAQSGFFAKNASEIQSSGSNLSDEEITIFPRKKHTPKYDANKDEKLKGEMY